MKLPERIRVLIITLSDRASKGEYEDLSGPAVEKLVLNYFNSTTMSCSADRVLIPDDSDQLAALIKDSVNKSDIIFTTGGTGIGPRDITVETIRPLLTKEIPGIMEFIRMKYGMEKPNALLSRGVSGLIDKCLIYTLPGSVRAVNEYMAEITKTLEHTLLMLYGIDKHKI
jgi:molybdenum cofactor synthesis domain-containing protein